MLKRIGAVAAAALMAAACQGPRNLTHDEAVRALAEEGFALTSPGGCFDKERLDCVSLDGIRSETVEGLIALKKRCEICGQVYIVSGTERGHIERKEISHANGYIVDVAESRGDGDVFGARIKRLIWDENRTIDVRPRQGYLVRRDGFRYLFVKDGAVWHISVDRS